LYIEHLWKNYVAATAMPDSGTTSPTLLRGVIEPKKTPEPAKKPQNAVAKAPEQAVAEAVAQ
jgi:hypothetical protein